MNHRIYRLFLITIMVSVGMLIVLLHDSHTPKHVATGTNIKTIDGRKMPKENEHKESAPSPTLDDKKYTLDITETEDAKSIETLEKNKKTSIPKQSEQSQNKVSPSTDDPEERLPQEGTIVTNYKSIGVVINKKKKLPANYVPNDLVAPDVPFTFQGYQEKRLMRSEAANALEIMFRDAHTEEIELIAASGYRSYIRQNDIFSAKVKQVGKKAATHISAVPGHSEHQTGLAMDVTSNSVGLRLRTAFGSEPEGLWLHKNAYKYGFIIRYPQGAENITGYQYEPWHLRYLGVNLATNVYKSGLTLEEYLETM